MCFLLLIVEAKISWSSIDLSRAIIINKYEISIHFSRIKRLSSYHLSYDADCPVQIVKGINHLLWRISTVCSGEFTLGFLEVLDAVFHDALSSNVGD